MDSQPSACHSRFRGMTRDKEFVGRAPCSKALEGLIKQGACSAGSAVDLLEASCFRSSAAVKDARYARRLRRSKTIDGGKTSEVHAAMRSTAACVAGGGRGRGKVWCQSAIERKVGTRHPNAVGIVPDF